MEVPMAEVRPDEEILLTHFIVSNVVERSRHEIRCHIRDTDVHLVEVGQTTDPEGDWSPAHWPSTTSGGESE
jgi:hypothetical protein